MSDIKTLALGSKWRTATFAAGWCAAALAMILLLIPFARPAGLAVGVLSFALLMSSAVLATRALLWRQNQDHAALMSAVRQALPAGRTERDHIDQLVNELRRAVSNFENRPLEQPVPKLPGEAIPIEQRILISGLTPEQQLFLLWWVRQGERRQALLVTDQPNWRELSRAASYLELPLTVASSNPAFARVVDDVRRFDLVAFEPGFEEPAAVIPMSWIGPDTKIIYLSSTVDSDRLVKLNRGLPVDFASVPGKQWPVEISIRRRIA